VVESLLGAYSCASWARWWNLIHLEYAALFQSAIHNIRSYPACSRLLALDEAVILLQEAFEKTGENCPHQILGSLARLLARQGHFVDAAKLLRHQISFFRRGADVVGTVENLVYLSAAAKQPDWIYVPDGQEFENQRLLASCIRLQLSDSWKAAIEAASGGAELKSGYVELKLQEVYCRLAFRQAPDTDQAIRPLVHGTPAAWLRLFAAIERGKLDTDSSVLADSQGCLRPIHSREDLLRIWDSPLDDFEPHPATYFPILPASLTGLDRTVIRPPTGEPVLGEVFRQTLGQIASGVPELAAVKKASAGGEILFRQTGDGWEIRPLQGSDSLRFGDDKGFGYLHKIIQHAGSYVSVGMLKGTISVIPSAIRDVREIKKELTDVQAELEKQREERDATASAPSTEITADEKENRLACLDAKIKSLQDHITTTLRSLDGDEQMRAEGHAIQQCINRAMEKLRDPESGCTSVADEIAQHLERESYQWKYEPTSSSPKWILSRTAAQN